MPEPSPFFRQHHGLEAPAIDFGAWRPYWRIRTRLDRLLLDGAITAREWGIASRLRSAFEAAQAGIMPIHQLDGDPRRARAASPPSGHRADALARLNQLRATLGSLTLGLLQACLVEDCSWAWLGKCLAVDPKTARAWTIAAIHALAALG
jgi:hypothetical protein